MNLRRRGDETSGLRAMKNRQDKIRMTLMYIPTLLVGLSCNDVVKPIEVASAIDYMDISSGDIEEARVEGYLNIDSEEFKVEALGKLAHSHSFCAICLPDEEWTMEVTEPNLSELADSILFIGLKGFFARCPLNWKEKYTESYSIGTENTEAYRELFPDKSNRLVSFVFQDSTLKLTSLTDGGQSKRPRAATGAAAMGLLGIGILVLLKIRI